MKKDNWPFKLFSGAVAFIAVALVAVIDFVTGYETAVSLLYMVPIVLAVWFSWRHVAILAAMLSGVSDVVVNYASNRSYTVINALNAEIQISFFVVFAYVLLALKRSQGRLKAMSRTDPLTGSVNSRHFSEIGNAEIGRALRYRHPFSVAYIDIDNFKAVNDALGHSAGDDLLRQIAGKAKTAIRKTDTIARIGGDEFAVLFPETGRDGARAIIQRMRSSILDIKVPGVGKVTFSMGVVTDAGQPCTFDEIMKAADGLMYEAKRGGKNTVREGLFGE